MGSSASVISYCWRVGRPLIAPAPPFSRVPGNWLLQTMKPDLAGLEKVGEKAPSSAQSRACEWEAIGYEGSFASTTFLSWKGDNSWKPSLTFVLPVPSLLVHPDGRRQKPNILTRRSQNSGWMCLYEVERTSFPSCLCRKERLSAFYFIP